MDNNTQILENIENNDTNEQEEEEQMVPIVIEKKPRKKRETNSEAQLATLKRGRERLAEQQKKKREMKHDSGSAKNTATIDFEKKHDDYMIKLNEIQGKINDSLNSFVSYTNVPEDITRQVDSSVVVTKKNIGIQFEFLLLKALQELKSEIDVLKPEVVIMKQALFFNVSS